MGTAKAVRAATTPPHVLVIGGGFGGATVAKYLKLWGGNIDVTLIDRSASHYACILSNLVVTGALPMDRIKLGYTNLQTKRGVNFAQGEALVGRSGRPGRSPCRSERTIYRLFV